MNAQTFHKKVGELIQQATHHGIAKGKMTALDVAGILNNHCGNVLQIIAVAEAEANAIEVAQASKAVLTVPFERNVREANVGAKPAEDQGK